MKDLHGNEIDAPVFNDQHGRKVDHKGNLINQAAGEVKHGVEAAGKDGLALFKHVAEAIFPKHEDATPGPAEPAKTETPAEVPAAPEVKAEADKPAGSEAAPEKKAE